MKQEEDEEPPYEAVIYELVLDRKIILEKKKNLETKVIIWRALALIFGLIVLVTYPIRTHIQWGLGIALGVATLVFAGALIHDWRASRSLPKSTPAVPADDVEWFRTEDGGQGFFHTQDGERVAHLMPTEGPPSVDTQGLLRGLQGDLSDLEKRAEELGYKPKS